MNRYGLRIPLVCLLIIVGTCASTYSQSAQSKDDLDRQHAFELWDNGKLVAAMPLLESLAVKYSPTSPLKNAGHFPSLPMPAP